MTELLTAAQMRAIEQAAIASGEVTGLELMERAGQGVVEAIFEEWPELAGGGASPSSSPGYLGPDEGNPLRAVVLCGPGNNGGDGFVIARLLRDLGWEVEVFLYGDPEKLPPDARVNYERWQQLGGVGKLSMPVPDATEIAQVDEVTAVAHNVPEPSLIIDALFGTGLSRPIDGLLHLLSECQLDEPAESSHPPYIVAIDTPSGLCADSGRILGEEDGVCVAADLTVSFHRMKVGHVTGSGPEFCGNMKVADIGLDTGDWGRRALAQLYGVDIKRPGQLGRHTVYLSDALPIASSRLTKRSGHKFSHGHALILSGSFGKTGAARLAARGALRIGAGLVTLGVPPAAQMEVASQIAAIMMRRVDSPDGLAGLLQDDRLNALCLGPGMGLDRAAEMVPVALASRRPTVLDADALTAFADDPAALFEQLHEKCVLTPHGGEFARLFPEIAGKLNAEPSQGPAFSKVDATREAARRAGCVVLFKGPDTVIAAPDGRCTVNAAQYERAAPWLATAGSGDVLAGFITGLLAREFTPMQAAETAAWLHVECARHFGPGLIAEDLPEQIPEVYKYRNL